MSMRDRPRLSDRFRGKSGSDLMNEIKKEFEDNQKSWFANRPSSNFNSFRREGFPGFENDDVFGKKSDAGIKSHLEDLAKKHPEFANNLRCPPWGGSLKDSWDKAFSVPISVDKNANASNDQQKQSNQNHSEQQTPQQESQEPVKEDRNNCQPASTEEGLKQHGLRNTVDIVDLQKDQKSNDEQKRASSAPPDTAPVDGQSTMSKPEQKRFTSKIEITPVNPFEENSASSQSANGNSGSSNSANATADSKMSNNAREIPIQTTNSENFGSPRMGRSRTSSGAREIPIHTDRMQTHSPYDSPTMSRKQPQIRQIPIFVEGRKSPVIAKDVEEPVERSNQFQPDQAPLKRKLDANGARASPPQPSNGQSQQKQQPPQERELPTEQPPPAPQPPPPPPKPKDPMERIQEVKEEVESLSNRVQQYSGKSRTDKDYLYLDEMLTRNLIKLDLIEVEGNDKLRTARKDVIKSIQKAIALLENKAPTAELGDKETQNQSAEASSDKPPMDVDNSQTKTAVNEKKTKG